MRKISLQTIEELDINAVAKAREDVNQIVDELGYHPTTFGSRSPIGFARVLKRYYDIFSLKFLLRKGDEVFFQFPWIHNNKPAFYRNLFASGARVSCVIHDLDSLRETRFSVSEEIEVLKRCHRVIAHTPAMKEFLEERGVKRERIEILRLFDYLTDVPYGHIPETSQLLTIVFAGNFEKSAFVKELFQLTGSELCFNLYGKSLPGIGNVEKNIVYKGAFLPDEVHLLEGNWGLVWDGPSLNTCSGVFGEYLRYNASHKNSLYLAAGIPLIVWKESAVAEYIVANHLGIAVKSLFELKDRLAEISSEAYNELLASVQLYAQRLRKGENLKVVLER